MDGVLGKAATYWPQFRGPGGSGVADGQKPPIHFGPGSNELWKVSVPAGASWPCVWGKSIFLTAFNDGKLETICLNRNAPMPTFEIIAAKEDADKDGVITYEEASPMMKSFFASYDRDGGKRLTREEWDRFSAALKKASVKGTLSVLDAGEKPEVRGRAEFNERLAATPAIVHNKIYVRTADHLWAFGK